MTEYLIKALNWIADNPGYVVLIATTIAAWLAKSPLKPKAPEPPAKP